MAFKIRFQGLVCHVSQGGETAVFVAGPPSPRHELRLVVSDPADIIAVTFIEDSVFASGAGRSFQIAGQHLVLTGVTGQIPTTSTEYQRNVPSLSAMTTCTTLREEIIRRRVTTDVVGYLDHPGGHFSVEAYYPFKASIADGREPAVRCVGSIVGLTLTPSARATEIEITGERGRVVLKPTATIDIMNTTRTPSPGRRNIHFHHYNALFGPGCGLRTEPIETTEPCSEGGENEKSSGAECSNSHIP